MGKQDSVEIVLGHRGTELLLAGGEIGLCSTGDHFHAGIFVLILKGRKAIGGEGIVSTERHGPQADRLNGEGVRIMGPLE